VGDTEDLLLLLVGRGRSLEGCDLGRERPVHRPLSKGDQRLQPRGAEQGKWGGEADRGRFLDGVLRVAMCVPTRCRHFGSAVIRLPELFCGLAQPLTSTCRRREGASVERHGGSVIAGFHAQGKGGGGDKGRYRRHSFSIFASKLSRFSEAVGSV